MIYSQAVRAIAETSLPQNGIAAYIMRFPNIELVKDCEKGMDIGLKRHGDRQNPRVECSVRWWDDVDGQGAEGSVLKDSLHLVLTRFRHCSTLVNITPRDVDDIQAVIEIGRKHNSAWRNLYIEPGLFLDDSADMALENLGDVLSSSAAPSSVFLGHGWKQHSGITTAAQSRQALDAALSRLAPGCIRGGRLPFEQAELAMDLMIAYADALRSFDRLDMMFAYPTPAEIQACQTYRIPD